jgi:hypothetical protein
VALAVLGVTLKLREHRRRDRVIADGSHTTGWLVQAHQNIFDEGSMDEAGLVLVSPDPEVAEDREFMTELAEKVMELKGTDPDDCDTKGEARVAELMADETYVEGKRDRLPKSFTGGKEVYLAHVYIYRDHLPGKKLTRRRVPCAIVWDDEAAMICSRPPSKKEKRRYEEDEDEE